MPHLVGTAILMSSSSARSNSACGEEIGKTLGFGLITSSPGAGRSGAELTSIPSPDPDATLRKVFLPETYCLARRLHESLGRNRPLPFPTALTETSSPLFCPPAPEP